MDVQIGGDGEKKRENERGSEMDGREGEGNFISDCSISAASITCRQARMHPEMCWQRCNL